VRLCWRFPPVMPRLPGSATGRLRGCWGHASQDTAQQRLSVWTPRARSQVWCKRGAWRMGPPAPQPSPFIHSLGTSSGRSWSSASVRHEARLMLWQCQCTRRPARSTRAYRLLLPVDVVGRPRGPREGHVEHDAIWRRVFGGPDALHARLIVALRTQLGQQEVLQGDGELWAGVMLHMVAASFCCGPSCCCNCASRVHAQPEVS
jgi:hypothetical protein